MKPKLSPQMRDLASIAEALLFVLGVVCLAAFGWHHLEAQRFQDHARTVLASSDSGSAETGPASGRPDPGSPIGMLEIPRLDLSVVVAEGTDEAVLGRAVGRLPSSSLPGDGGNLALAGHRDTFFKPLEDVRAGDEVIFEGAGGQRATYEVSWVRVVEPDEIWVAEPTFGESLTLITCYPFRYVGTAPQRYVVRARRIDAREEIAALESAPVVARAIS